MDFLTDLFDQTNIPLLSAFILGLMTAISPCPMATNITAIGFISRDIDKKRRVFINGVIYTLGRAITYFILALVFYFGASQFKVSGFIQLWGEQILGPLLIIIGLFMLDVVKIKFPGFNALSRRMEANSKKGFGGVLLLGIVFALAFCPYSGVLYFGMLIPMTISSSSGLYLPLVFAIGTGIPVIIFAWLIAFTLGQVGQIYQRVRIFETWFRRVISVLFIGVGLYYVYIIWL